MIEAIRKRWCVGEGMRSALDRIAYTQGDIATLLAEVDRLRKRTHEIQETADKRYSELRQRTEKPLEYWRSALTQADNAMKGPDVVFHSAITRAKAADLFMQIERLRAALAEVMVPIEALTVAGEDAWELAPEVRGELMTARTLGRAALGFTPVLSDASRSVDPA